MRKEVKILIPHVTAGYLIVNLYSNGRIKHFLIHRLVMLAFV